MQFQDYYLLKKLTTLGIGGPAKKFVVVKTQKELIKAIQSAKNQKLPYLLIGSGSNLLVADEGFSGLIIKNELHGIAQDQQILRVKSGTSLQDIVDYSIRQGLTGLQKLTGIPGTVGGAVYGNAGAYGQSISDYITTVQILDASNFTTRQFNNSNCNFTYRDSIFKKNKAPIVEIAFRLDAGDPTILMEEAKAVLEKRLVKYPPGIKCPGSFFKNLVAAELPPDIIKKIPPEKIIYGKLPAGSLLEEVGAKGQKLDGIAIATNHANLFINKDGGNARAFYNLAKTYAKKVKEKYGIILEPEVQLINLFWNLN